MKKLYNDLDKLDGKLKKYGCFDLNREPCFAETSIDRCSALREKDCYECNFYKPLTSQIEVTKEDIRKYKGLIPEQSFRTLIAQAEKGDLKGARRGFDRVKKQGGL